LQLKLLVQYPLIDFHVWNPTKKKSQWLEYSNAEILFNCFIFSTKAVQFQLETKQ